MSEENQYQSPSSNVETANNTEVAAVRLFAVSGRIGRIRYLAYSFGISIVLIIMVMLATFLSSLSGIASYTDGGSGDLYNIGTIIAVVLTIAAYIFFFVLSIMLTIQRAHDFNASGWLSLIYFIPFVSLIFLFIPGTNGENQYGLKTPPNGAATIVVIVMFLLIPIIGILAAIAIPAYQGYVESAKQIQIEQTK